MSEKRTSLEVIAPSTKEAIDKGLADLGLPQDAVEVEVLDEGNRGLFGLGARQARVRIMVKSAFGEGPLPQIPAQGTEEMKEPAVSVGEQVEDDSEIAISSELLVDEDDSSPADIAGIDEDSDLLLGVAGDTVKELLDTMHVRADVSARYLEPDDAHSRPAILVDVRGNDLSILIGPRGETLNALQYIAHLIVGKELGRSVPLVVDVEGYRERRSQQIRRLARRMAEQAVRSGRRQSLEPMSPSDRRLVHIELRKNPHVQTESVGEDPRRKVTIIPD